MSARRPAPHGLRSRSAPGRCGAGRPGRGPDSTAQRGSGTGRRRGRPCPRPFWHASCLEGPGLFLSIATNDGAIPMQLKATVFLSSLVLSGAVLAQAKAPEPDYTLSYNLGAVTDYRYRGISQTGGHPALQGGIDFAHKSGFYLGTWASTIHWIKDSSNAAASVKGP